MINLLTLHMGLPAEEQVGRVGCPWAGPHGGRGSVRRGPKGSGFGRRAEPRRGNQGGLEQVVVGLAAEPWLRRSTGRAGM